MNGGERTKVLTKVLIVDSDQRRSRDAVERLGANGCLALWVAQDRAAAVEAARDHQPEIAVIELGFRDCDGPAVALRVAAMAPHVETVFFAGPKDEGEVAAARDLGLGRVVPLDDLISHLDRIVVPLGEAVRLRRRLEEVERRLRLLSDESWGRAGPERIALPEAERRYRETYVRSLLAETGNRREAARRAGVPYTTFCEIMRKLGIPQELS